MRAGSGGAAEGAAARSTAPLRRLMLQARRGALLSSSTLDHFCYAELVEGAAAVCGGAPLPAPPRVACGFPACVTPGALVRGSGGVPLFVRPLPTASSIAPSRGTAV